MNLYRDPEEGLTAPMIVRHEVDIGTLRRGKKWAYLIYTTDLKTTKFLRSRAMYNDADSARIAARELIGEVRR